MVLKNMDVKTDKPLVSVCIITYNHVAYISQCLDSVLEQKTTFPFEVVIGEDCSTDNTRKIIETYRQKYPEKILLITSDHNVGMQPNAIRTLNTCRGKYIALCEGDDYWTDSFKLQKQVTVLDNHPEWSICFHNVERHYQNKTRKPTRFNPPTKKKIYNLEDLLKGNFIHTSSVMYRNKLFGEFPVWYYNVAVGDWPLFILNAQYGDIGYINEIMSVYRIHEGGIHSPQTRLSNSQKMIEIYKFMNVYFHFEYDKIIQSGIYLHQYYIAKDSKNWGQAILNLWRCVTVSPCNHAITYRRLFGTFQHHFNG